MSGENWQRLQAGGAVWDYPGHGPHAVYDMASKHADFYLNTDIVVSHPPLAKAITDFFAATCEAQALRPDWVAGYFTPRIASGLPLAAMLAGKLNARYGSIDLAQSRACFDPAPNDTILLVSDDIYSGGSLATCLTCIEQAGAVVAPLICTIANFSGHPQWRGRSIAAYVERDGAPFTPADCPLCRAGSPALHARREWQELIAGQVLKGPG